MVRSSDDHARPRTDGERTEGGSEWSRERRDDERRVSNRKLPFGQAHLTIQMSTTAMTSAARNMRGTVRQSSSAARQLGAIASGPSSGIRLASSSSSVRRSPRSATEPATLRSSRPLLSTPPSASLVLSQRRNLHATSALSKSDSSGSSITTSRELNIHEYSILSERVLESLVGQLEALIDESDPSSSADWEVEYSQGVLTLKLPPSGTYVLNKQPPNKQIWLSSPISGPKKFDYTDKDQVWVCRRTGEQDLLLHELLQGEWSKIFGQEVELFADL